MITQSEIDPKFLRYSISNFGSVAALFPPEARRGIYILEFANGEQYVGQALNVVARFSAHRHGSKHHPPWDDVVAIQFLHVPSDSLTPIEFAHIDRLRSEGVELRNKVRNLGHLQPSALDEHVSVEDQEHWVLGQGVFGQQEFESIDTPEETKLAKNLKRSDPELRRWVLDDIHYALTELIPNAAELEKRYWTLSDYPGTAGGRFATLNVGVLEYVVFPRSTSLFDEAPDENFVFLNLPKGTIIADEDWELYFGYFLEAGDFPVFCMCHSYSLCDTDALYLPAGTIRLVLESDPRLKEAVREMAVELMRQNTSGLFARWHSPALVRETMHERFS